jgi:hypothetical protein
MGRIVTAEYRSRQFLLEHLNWWQRITFKWRGVFTVRGQKSRGRYYIGKRWVTRWPRSYCLRVYDGHGDPVPVYDAMLAKKILLECDELTFLNTANY